MSMKTLAARLQYQGGMDQNSRIRETKLRSFRAALKSSYNSHKIKVPNHSVWPCLISKNLLKSDYDRQYVSVEFESGLDAGEVFERLDDGTHWMVYLPVLTESAYLRSEIIRCRYILTIDDVDYWIYFQGPTETTIQWFQKTGRDFNEPNLSGTIYIKKDSRTENFFKRFTKIKLAGHTWQVQVVDSITVPGIIELEIQEYYDNTIAELPKIKDEGCHEIVGDATVEQKKDYGYIIRDAYYNPSYSWRVEGNNRVELINQLEDNRQCEVRVHDGAVGSYKIIYGDSRSGYSLDVEIARRCNGIVGPREVYPFDIVTYKTQVAGKFYVSVEGTKVVEATPTSCTVEITTGRTGEFTVTFEPENGEDSITQKVKILSL